MIKTYLTRLLRTGFNSKKYWESRYAAGGNSGDGSYGRLAAYKAAFINDFISKNNIRCALEMGCGDGHQLSIINYPQYIGLDVSETIIRQCIKKFSADQSKTFRVYNPLQTSFPDNSTVDLALSLDVIYHIVELKTYLKYLQDLFNASSSFVIIYSTDFYLAETEHVLHRKFTDDVKKLFTDWQLIHHEPNPYPGNGEQESMAAFYVYKKRITTENQE
jgi:SAM-dependent methyltransferase